MSDIFREVEEDVRKERLERLWKAYGDYAIALIVAAVLGVGGWQLWQRYEDSQRAKASASLVAAQSLTNPAQAAAAFEALSKTAPGGYGELAKLGQANALSLTRRADAVALYKDVANSDSGPLGAVARLRAAWLVADTAPRGDLESLLSPINTPASGWREMAREVLAYNDYKAGKLLAAQAGFDALINDPDTPDALRSRARAFSAYLHEGGSANYGTVPPPAPTPAPGSPPGGTPAPPGGAAPAATPQAGGTP